MMSITRIATLAAALVLPAVACDRAVAQTAPSLSNSKIEFSYFPPKTVKYQAIMERLKAAHLLEQMSQFLSPLRLPHKFYLVTTECGKINAFYSSDMRAIILCYEFVELVERLAPKADAPAGEFSRDEVLVGAIAGVMLHEGGHAVFDMLDVPVFGREEDAADAMANFLALQFNKDVARTVVKGFAYLWRSVGNPKDWSEYADEHGTSAQRFYNALCTAYGGDPATFKEFVDKGWLPKERAENCAAEYQQTRYAFIKTILPFVDPEMLKLVQAKDWLKPAK
jgi:putative metallopeptidase DUF4344